MFKSASLLYLILLTTTSSIVEAQSNFSKTYLASGYDWSIGTNINHFNNNYLLTLSEYPTSNQEYNKVRHLMIDESGNIINDWLLDGFNSHTYPVKSNGNQLSPDKIYSILFNQVQGQAQSFGLATLDLMNDTIKYKDYAYTSSIAPYSIISGQGDSLILYADEVEGDDTSKWVTSLTFYDTGTGADTTISYKGNYHRPQPGEVKTLPNGDILMAFGAIDYSLPLPNERGFLQKISADGRLLWKKAIYPGLRWDFKPTLLPLPNGDIAYGWTKDSFSTSHPPAYYVQRPVAVFFLDSMGEFKSRAMLGPIFGKLNNLELLANGDVLGMGWKGMAIEGRAGNVGWVFRLSPTGEKIWERLIAYPTTESAPNLKFYDAVESQNGDILLAGSRNLEDRKLGSWLLKISPDGCYDPDDCGGVKDTIFIYEDVVSTNTPEKTEIGLEIYPNPTSGSFTVRLPAVHETFGRKTLSIFDVGGREVHRQPYTTAEDVVLAKRLPPGVYLVKMETLLGTARGKVVIR